MRMDAAVAHPQGASAVDPQQVIDPVAWAVGLWPTSDSILDRLEGTQAPLDVIASEPGLQDAIEEHAKRRSFSRGQMALLPPETVAWIRALRKRRLPLGPVFHNADFRRAYRNQRLAAQRAAINHAQRSRTQCEGLRRNERRPACVSRVRRKVVRAVGHADPPGEPEPPGPSPGSSLSKAYLAGGYAVDFEPPAQEPPRHLRALHNLWELTRELSPAERKASFDRLSIRAKIILTVEAEQLAALGDNRGPR
ncbi:MAG: hypothetical protein QOI20_3232 [Acidimicrobiaceae bacterium]|nr:hypothetical protein [Acidimicrobiaceae bacterium]